jgi:hypothetical protein
MIRSARMRGRRLPILVVYLLVLVGSPVGEAGSLWVHLTSSHRGSATGLIAPPPASEPVSVAAVEEATLHTHGVHSHRHSEAESIAAESDSSRTSHPPRHPHAHPPADHLRDGDDHSHQHPAGREEPPAAPDAGAPSQQPEGPVHAHENGLVHSHESRTPDDATSENPLSRFYLAPPPVIALAPVASRTLRTPLREAPQETVPAVDTPPPRITV